jgi:uncharacterized protein (TIGR03067 family)
MKGYPSFGLAIVLGLTSLGWGRAEDTKDEAIKKHRKLCEGTWRVVDLEVDGIHAADANTEPKIIVAIKANGNWSLEIDGRIVGTGTWTIDPTKKLKTIDLTFPAEDAKAQTALGIYEIDRDIYKLCIAITGKARPSEFSSERGSCHILATFQREKQ